MTVSTFNNNNTWNSAKGIKRAYSFPKSLQLLLVKDQQEQREQQQQQQEGSASPCKDSLLQSCNPRRRYMRRGSRCPSMLRTSFSLPRDLSSMVSEGGDFSTSSGGGGGGGAAPSTSEIVISNNKSFSNVFNRSAVDLVNEALNLSSNFDELDLDSCSAGL